LRPGSLFQIGADRRSGLENLAGEMRRQVGETHEFKVESNDRTRESESTFVVRLETVWHDAGKAKQAMYRASRVYSNFEL
jgi:hypothetical protein